jgi:hypothetical protein
MKVQRYVNDSNIQKIDPANCENAFEPGDEVRHVCDLDSYGIVVANDVKGITVMWSVAPMPGADAVREMQKQIATELDAVILNDLATAFSRER